MAGKILAVATVGLACAAVAASGPSHALRDSSELAHGCFGFPAKSFNRANCVKDSYGASPHTAGGLAVGDAAFDFTIKDVDGNAVSLADLVATKPVLMVWGMWTCPAYQGLGTDAPFDQCSYKHEWDLVEKYQGSVHFLHLVGPEPHPAAPDVNFDAGKLLLNYWSTERQPRDYAGRVELAQRLAEYTHPGATLLVDDLSSEPGAANNGVWCSMGLGARTAVLVGTDGKVAYSKDWFHAGDAQAAIETYFASQKVWTGLGRE